MINFVHHGDRHVIPQWLDFRVAAGIGELDLPHKKPVHVDLEKSKGILERDYSDFLMNHDPVVASELMGIALVLGDIEKAVLLAQFNTKNPATSKSVLFMAQRIIERNSPQSPIAQAISNPNAAIHELKQQTLLNPFDSIAWTERARLHTIKGQDTVAEKCLLRAIYLAPSNRYVVRCAVRFFLHTRQFDKAWYYAIRANQLTPDLWVAASAISSGQLAGEKMNKALFAPAKIIQATPSFHYSEYLAAVAMTEHSYGSDKKAKKLFQVAWKNPSRNVITHAEWILREVYPGLQDRCVVDTTLSAEAETWKHYHEMEVDKAIIALRRWNIEEPYSKQPYILGSYLLCKRKQYDEAIRLARNGRDVSPENLTINNNLAYSLLRRNQNGDLVDAEQILKELTATGNRTDEVVVNATRGLLAYRQGKWEEGRKLYHDAIQLAKDLKKPALAKRAFVAMAIAEEETCFSEADSDAQKALVLLANDKEPELLLARMELLSLMGDSK